MSTREKQQQIGQLLGQIIDAADAGHIVQAERIAGRVRVELSDTIRDLEKQVAQLEGAADYWRKLAHKRGLGVRRSA